MRDVAKSLGSLVFVAHLEGTATRIDDKKEGSKRTIGLSRGREGKKAALPNIEEVYATQKRSHSPLPTVTL